MKSPMRGALSSIAVGALFATMLTVPAFADPLTTPDSPSKIVNTFIGTEGQGNTYPGATAPFGMTQVTPTSAWFPGYAYNDKTIFGFSTQSVSGAGCWEQGGVLPIMPTTGKIGPGQRFNTSNSSSFNYKNYGSTYTHDGEVGQAGYYRTMLTGFGGIDVETTATERVGVQRYTFPATTDANIFFNVGQANGVSAPNQWMKMKIHKGSVTIDEDGIISGWAEAQGFCTNKDYTYRQYFASKINVPVTGYGTWNSGGGQAGRMSAEKTAENQMLGAWATIDTTENQKVEVTTAISYTSVEGAKANLRAEGLDEAGQQIPFDSIKDQTQAKWDDLLKRVRVYGGSSDDQVVFYSALYHALLQPSLGTDADGKYFGFDKKVHTAEGWNYYQYFSLWDTFRTQNQLLAAFYPEYSKDLGRSVMAIYAQAGWLTRWAYATYESGAMSGDPVTAYLADMWRYGTIDEDSAVVLDAADTLSGQPVPLDIDTAYEALMKNVDQVPPAELQFSGRSGNDTYISRGYIVHQQNVGSLRKGHSDDREFAGSATLEYAVSDCAAAVMNDQIGTPQDARRLADRAGNWRNVWDMNSSNAGFTGFPRARTATGWTQFNATKTDGQPHGFEEATPWQYQFLTWQDAPGWTKTVGGKDGAMNRLDTFFSTGTILNGTDAWKTLAKTAWVSGALDYSGAKYNPNNEPDLHAPMYYAFLDTPLKTSAVNRTAQRLFTNGSTGVTGNDDLGTMSAWYVFSTLGMYPSVAGTGDLILTAPRFEKVEIDLRDGNTLTITAPGATGEKLQFISGVTLNDQPVVSNWVSIDDVLAGGNLDVALTEDQSTSWGTGADDGPLSRCSSELGFRGVERSVKAYTPLEGEIGTLVGPASKITPDSTLKIVWEDGTESALAASDDLARSLSLVEGTVTSEQGTRSGTVAVSTSDGATIAEFPYSYQVTEGTPPVGPGVVDPVKPSRVGNAVVVPVVGGVVYRDGAGNVLSGEVGVPLAGLTVFARAVDGNRLNPELRASWLFPYDMSARVMVDPVKPERSGNAVVVPVVVGVSYLDGDGNVLAAGTVLVSRANLVVRAVPVSGFRLNPELRASWLFAYDMSARVVVDPVKPARDGRSITIPVVEGVVYRDGAGSVLSGVVSVPKGNLVVLASPVDGYRLNPELRASWLFPY